MNLYSIPAAYQAWLERVEAQGGEIDARAAADLGVIEDTLEQKAEAICALVRGAQAEANTYRGEAAYWSQKARVAENRARRLKELLLRAMQATGCHRLKGSRFLVTCQPGIVPRFRWEGSGAPPAWATRQTVELDPKALRKAYEAGAALEGFAVELTDYLVIR